jgi:hypothetical protein
MMPGPDDPNWMTWGYECPRTHSPSAAWRRAHSEDVCGAGERCGPVAGQPSHMRDEDLVPLTAGGLPRPSASSHRSSAQTLRAESGPPATGLLRPGLRALGRGCGASGQPGKGSLVGDEAKNPPDGSRGRRHPLCTSRIGHEHAGRACRQVPTPGGTHHERDQGTPTGTDPGGVEGPRNRGRAFWRPLGIAECNRPQGGSGGLNRPRRGRDPAPGRVRPMPSPGGNYHPARQTPASRHPTVVPVKATLSWPVVAGQGSQLAAADTAGVARTGPRRRRCRPAERRWLPGDRPWRPAVPARPRPRCC